MIENKTNEHLLDNYLNMSDIRQLIYFIRGQKVMFDKDLAMLYGVSTGVLNQAIKRNIERFPSDFMFRLSLDEYSNLKSQFTTSSLRSQFVTSKKVGRGGTRTSPYVFTEQGIAMLSSVLNSKKAIQINIQIIRIFTKLRQMIDDYRELRERVEEMEKNNETNFTEIFRIIRLFIREENEPKHPIGFDTTRVQ
jgi:tetrahydromethanopterin S-methyltransferase subunit G